MPKQFKCPNCGAVLDPAQLREESELKDLEGWFLRDWPLVAEYLDLFRVRPDAPMATKKRLRLAKEIQEIWKGGYFEFDGQKYWIDEAQLRAALRAVCNRELRGLRNHNYLKIVLKGGQGKRSAGGDACATRAAAPPGKYAGRSGRHTIEAPDE